MAPLLSVYSPFGDGVPCDVAVFQSFFSTFPSFDRASGNAVSGSVPGDIRHTPPQPSPSSLDVCAQGHGVCLAEQLTICDFVGPKQP